MGIERGHAAGVGNSVTQRPGGGKGAVAQGAAAGGDFLAMLAALADGLTGSDALALAAGDAAQADAVADGKAGRRGDPRGDAWTQDGAGAAGADGSAGAAAAAMAALLAAGAAVAAGSPVAGVVAGAEAVARLADVAAAAMAQGDAAPGRAPAAGGRPAGADALAAATEPAPSGPMADAALAVAAGHGPTVDAALAVAAGQGPTAGTTNAWTTGTVIDTATIGAASAPTGAVIDTATGGAASGAASGAAGALTGAAAGATGAAATAQDAAALRAVANAQPAEHHPAYASVFEQLKSRLAAQEAAGTSPAASRAQAAAQELRQSERMLGPRAVAQALSAETSALQAGAADASTFGPGAARGARGGVLDGATSRTEGAWAAPEFTPTVQYDAGLGGVQAAAPMADGDAVPLAEQLRYWLSQGVTSAEWTVAGDADPVQVSLSLQGNEATITFRSEQAGTRELLAGSADQLRDLLQREGLVLSGMTVGAEGSGARGQQPGGEHTAPHSGMPRRAATGAGTGPAQAVATMPAAAARSTGGGVDLFV
jgi:flagellar hook-length control protein FliK